MIIEQAVTFTLEEIIMLNGMVTGQRLAMQHVANEPLHQEVLRTLHAKLNEAFLACAEKMPRKENTNGDR